MYEKNQKLTDAQARILDGRLQWVRAELVDHDVTEFVYTVQEVVGEPAEQAGTYVVLRTDPRDADSPEVTVLAAALTLDQASGILDRLAEAEDDITSVEDAHLFEQQAIAAAETQTTPAPPAPPTEGTTSSPVTFRPAGQHELAPSGKFTRIRANIAAIRILRTLEAEDRAVTPDEQRTLARWSSWGAVPEIFDPRQPRLDTLRAELRELLTTDEWNAAEATTRNAHFTDAALVAPIWKALTDLGLASGRVIEPGCGSGNFIGFAPSDISITGIELDPITAQIAAHLYPDAEIRNESFVDTRYPDGYFDAAVGNVPFDDIALADPRHNPHNLATHNHFIIKALDYVRDRGAAATPDADSDTEQPEELELGGGMVALLTSRYTLDSAGLTARKEIAARGDLVAAFRFPSGALRAAAGTDAVLDLLILQRRPEGTEPTGPSFVDLESVQLSPDTTTRINEYFVNHPEKILGTLGLGRGLYRDDELVVHPPENVDVFAEFATQLEAVVQQARAEGRGIKPADPAQRAETDAAAARYQAAWDMFGAELSRFEGSLVDNGDGKFEQVTGGELAARPVFRNAAEELSSLLALRDTYVQLLTADATEGASGDATELRQKLNQQYGAHTAKFGYLNKRDRRRDRRSAHGAFRTDPYAAGVYALENYDFENQTATKSDIFHGPTLTPRERQEQVETPAEALAVCLNSFGEVRLAEIARLLALDDPEQARDRLGDLVFQDPSSDALIPADLYLSQNIRDKLQQAETALRKVPEDERPEHPLQRNVSSLKQVLREKLPEQQPGDIEDVRLGATWIGPQYVQAFLREILNDRFLEVTHTIGGDWHVKAEKYTKQSNAATKIYGTKRRPAIELVERLLCGKSITVRPPRPDEDATPEDIQADRMLAAEETEAAQAKADELNRLFGDWVWADPQRTKELVRTYNEKFNSWLEYSGTGDHLTLEGLSDRYTLRPHQKEAVARSLVDEAGSFFDHSVGFGKTLSVATTVMERRRLGMSNKPCIVVPNHLGDQWRNDFLKAYPGARVLAVDSADFPKERRKEFIGRIANGDWDVVIMTQSVFDMIPVSKKGQEQYAAGETEGFREIIHSVLGGELRQDAPNPDGDPVTDEAVNATVQLGQAFEGSRSASKKTTIKHLQGELKRLTQKLARHFTKESDAGISWEQTGIDFLAVDEIQDYANLDIATRNSELSLNGSGRAAGLLTKLRVMEHRYGPRVGLGATGTPFPNSMTQAYVMLLLFCPQLLRRMGLHDFDAFAAQFMTTTTAAEIGPEGVPRMKERIGGFRNASVFSLIWRFFAHVRTSKQIKLHNIEWDTETITVPATDEDRAFMADIVERAEQVRTGQVAPEEDNLLSIANDGRMGAMDLRMVGWPPSEVGKLDAVIDRMYETWLANKNKRFEGSDIPGALQMGFADRGTPSELNRKKKNFIAYDYIRDGLIARGMPAHLIRYIHDAEDAPAKEALFKEAREGQVAVLLMSTQKGGTGVNAQNRCVALHHIDVPWRPADVTQREGRILRQGNQNENVKIFRYVQEGSFDAYMWQTVERKARFIEQIRTGRSTDELDATDGDLERDYLDYSEIKAVATGNPLLLKKMKADEELRVLETSYLSWRRTERHLRHLAENSGPDLERAREQSARIGAALAGSNIEAELRGDTFKMEADGTVHTKRVSAGAAIQKQLRQLRRRDSRPLSEWETIAVYDGQEIRARINRSQGFADFDIHGVPGTTFHIDGIDDVIQGSSVPLGIVTRIENKVAALDTIHQQYQAVADTIEQDIENAKALVGRPFSKQDKLTKARALVAQLEAEMDEQAGAAPEPDEAPPVAEESPKEPAPIPWIPLTAAQAAADAYFRDADAEQMQMAMLLGPYSAADDIAHGWAQIQQALGALINSGAQLPFDDAYELLEQQPSVDPMETLGLFQQLHDRALQEGESATGAVEQRAMELADLTQFHLGRMRATGDSLHDFDLPGMAARAQALSDDLPQAAVNDPLHQRPVAYPSRAEFTEARRALFEAYDQWPGNQGAGRNPKAEEFSALVWQLRDGMDENLPYAVREWGRALTLGLEVARTTDDPATAKPLQDALRRIYQHHSSLEAHQRNAERQAHPYLEPGVYRTAEADLLKAWRTWRSSATAELLTQVVDQMKPPELLDAGAAHVRLVQAAEVANGQRRADRPVASRHIVASEMANCAYALALALRPEQYAEGDDAGPLRQLISATHAHAAALELSDGDSQATQAIEAGARPLPNEGLADDVLPPDRVALAVASGDSGTERLITRMNARVHAYLGEENDDDDPQRWFEATDGQIWAFSHDTHVMAIDADDPRNPIQPHPGPGPDNHLQLPHHVTTLASELVKAGIVVNLAPHNGFPFSAPSQEGNQRPGPEGWYLRFMRDPHTHIILDVQHETSPEGHLHIAEAFFREMDEYGERTGGYGPVPLDGNVSTLQEIVEQLLTVPCVVDPNYPNTPRPPAQQSTAPELNAPEYDAPQDEAQALPSSHAEAPSLSGPQTMLEATRALRSEAEVSQHLAQEATGNGADFATTLANWAQDWMLDTWAYRAPEAWPAWAVAYFNADPDQLDALHHDLAAEVYTKLRGLDESNASRDDSPVVSVDAPDQPSTTEPSANQTHDRLAALLERAAVLFAKEWDSSVPEVQRALAYLVERGHAPDSEESALWGVGFARRGRENAVTGLLRGEGYTDAELEQVGLLRERDGRLNNLFFDRLIWPIRDLQGNVVGFTGRRMPGAGDRAPKYVNSPGESERYGPTRYNKSGLLLGMEHLSSRRGQPIYISEGPFELQAIGAAHRHGDLDRPVLLGTCGTALTTEHMKILREHGDTSQPLILAFNNDDAGRKALLRAWPLVKDWPGGAEALFPEGTVITPEGEEKNADFGDLHQDAERGPAEVLRQVKYNGTSLLPAVVESALLEFATPEEQAERVIEDHYSRLTAAAAAAAPYVWDTVKDADTEQREAAARIWARRLHVQWRIPPHLTATHVLLGRGEHSQEHKDAVSERALDVLGEDSYFEANDVHVRTRHASRHRPGEWPVPPTTLDTETPTQDTATPAVDDPTEGTDTAAKNETVQNVPTPTAAGPRPDAEPPTGPEAGDASVADHDRSDTDTPAEQAGDLRTPRTMPRVPDDSDLASIEDSQLRNTAFALGGYLGVLEALAAEQVLEALFDEVSRARPRRPRKRVGELHASLAAKHEVLRDIGRSDPEWLVDQLEDLARTAADLADTSDGVHQLAARAYAGGLDNHRARLLAHGAHLPALLEQMTLAEPEDPPTERQEDPLKLFPAPYADSVELEAVRAELFTAFRAWPGSRRRGADLTDRAAGNLRGRMRHLEETSDQRITGAITDWSEVVALLLQAADQRTDPAEKQQLRYLAQLARDHAARLIAPTVTAERSRHSLFTAADDYTASLARLTVARESWENTPTFSVLQDVTTPHPAGSNLPAASAAQQKLNTAFAGLELTELDDGFEDLNRHLKACSHTTYGLALSLASEDFARPDDWMALYELVEATYLHAALVRTASRGTRNSEILKAAIGPQSPNEEPVAAEQPTAPGPEAAAPPYDHTNEARADLELLRELPAKLGESPNGRDLIEGRIASGEREALLSALNSLGPEDLFLPDQPNLQWVEAAAGAARAVLDHYEILDIQAPLVIKHVTEMVAHADRLASRLTATASDPEAWRAFLSTAQAPVTEQAAETQGAAQSRQTRQSVVTEVRGQGVSVTRRGNGGTGAYMFNGQEMSLAQAADQFLGWGRDVPGVPGYRMAPSSPDEHAAWEVFETETRTGLAHISYSNFTKQWRVRELNGASYLADQYPTVEDAAPAAVENLAARPDGATDPREAQKLPGMKGFTVRAVDASEHADREVLNPDGELIARVTYHSFSSQWAGWVGSVPTTLVIDPLIAAKHAALMWAYDNQYEAARPEPKSFTSAADIRAALATVHDARQRVLNAAARAWPESYHTVPELEQLEAAFRKISERSAHNSPLGTAEEIRAAASDLATLRDAAEALRRRVADDSRQANADATSQGGSPRAADSEQFLAFPLVALLWDTTNLSNSFRLTAERVEERQETRAQEAAPPAPEADPAAAAPNTAEPAQTSVSAEPDSATPPQETPVATPDEAPVGGPWSDRIQLVEEGGSVFFTGTGQTINGIKYYNLEGELRSTLKSNGFRYSNNDKRWRYVKAVNHRAEAISTVQAYLAAKDAEEREAATAQPAKSEHPPTPQQQAVIDAALAGQGIVVQALAGTGKTTTMAMVARAISSKQITYVAFNASIAAEAQEKFPGNTLAKTSHAFAAAALRETPMRKKVIGVGKKGQPGAVWPNEIAEALAIAPLRTRTQSWEPEEVARMAMATVRAFRNSADDELSDHHLPPALADASTHARRQVLSRARDAWNDLRNPNSNKIRFDFDDYLKIWALTKPRLPGNVIIFDEAQDINPVLRKVIQDQEHQTIVVGDSNQSIYGFRGAVDALRDWPADIELPLTQSWRFGPEVARVGNAFLELLDSPLQLEGNPNLDTTLGPVEEPDAVLARTNVGAIGAVIEGLEAGRRVALMGGKKDIVDIAKAAKDLIAGRGTDHPDLKQFADWGEVRDHAEKEEDAKTLQTFVRLVDTYSAQGLIDMAARLVDIKVKEEELRPELVVSTAHKAKGLEFDNVRIADDFPGPSIDPETGETVLPKPETLRLMYVAVTRAQKRLDLGSLGWIQTIHQDAPEASTAPKPTPAPEQSHEPTSEAQPETEPTPAAVEPRPSPQPSSAAPDLAPSAEPTWRRPLPWDSDEVERRVRIALTRTQTTPVDARELQDDPLAQYAANVDLMLNTLPPGESRRFIAKAALPLQGLISDIASRALAHYTELVRGTPDGQTEQEALAAHLDQVWTFPEVNEPHVHEALHLILETLDSAVAAASEQGLEAETVRNWLEQIVGFHASMGIGDMVVPLMPAALNPVLAVGLRVRDVPAFKDSLQGKPMPAPESSKPAPEASAEQPAESGAEPEEASLAPEAAATAEEGNAPAEKPADSPAEGTPPAEEPDPDTAGEAPDGTVAPLTDEDLAATVTAWPSDDLGQFIASITTQRLSPLLCARVKLNSAENGPLGFALQGDEGLDITITDADGEPLRAGTVPWRQLAKLLSNGLTTRRRRLVQDVVQTRERLQRAYEGYLALGEYRHYEIALRELDTILSDAVADVVAHALQEQPAPLEAKDPSPGEQGELLSFEDLEQAPDSASEVKTAGARRRVGEFAAVLPDLEIADGYAAVPADLTVGQAIRPPATEEMPFSVFVVGAEPTMESDPGGVGELWEISGTLVHPDGRVEDHMLLLDDADAELTVHVVPRPESLASLVEAEPTPTAPAAAPEPIEQAAPEVSRPPAPTETTRPADPAAPSADAPEEVRDEEELDAAGAVPQDTTKPQVAVEEVELLWEAIGLVTELQFGSTSMLQRRLRMGLQQAKRLMGHMQELGVVGPPQKGKAREVLLTSNQLDDVRERLGIPSADRPQPEADETAAGPTTQPLELAFTEVEGVGYQLLHATSRHGLHVLREEDFNWSYRLELPDGSYVETTVPSETEARMLAALVEQQDSAPDRKQLARLRAELPEHQASPAELAAAQALLNLSVAHRNWVASATAQAQLAEDRELREQTGIDEPTNESARVEEARIAVAEGTGYEGLSAAIDEALRALSARDGFVTPTDGDLLDRLRAAAEARASAREAATSDRPAAPTTSPDTTVDAAPPVPQAVEATASPLEESSVTTPAPTPIPQVVTVDETVALLMARFDAAMAQRQIRPDTPELDATWIKDSFKRVEEQLGRISGIVESSLGPISPADDEAEGLDESEVNAALSEAQRQSAWYWGTPEWNQIRQLNTTYTAFKSQLKTTLKAVGHGLRSDVAKLGFLRTLDLRVARATSHSAFLLAGFLERKGQHKSSGYRSLWRLHRAAWTRAERILGNLSSGPGLGLASGIQAGWKALNDRIRARSTSADDAASTQAHGGQDRTWKVAAKGASQLDRIRKTAAGRLGALKDSRAWQTISGLLDSALSAYHNLQGRVAVWQVDVRELGIFGALWTRTMEAVASRTRDLMDKHVEKGETNSFGFNLIRLLHHTVQNQIWHARKYLEDGEQPPLGFYDSHPTQEPDLTSLEPQAPWREPAEGLRLWQAPLLTEPFGTQWEWTLNKVLSHFPVAVGEQVRGLLDREQQHFRAGSVPREEAIARVEWGVEMHLTNRGGQARHLLRQMPPSREAPKQEAKAPSPAPVPEPEQEPVTVGAKPQESPDQTTVKPAPLPRRTPQAGPQIDGASRGGSSPTRPEEDTRTHLRTSASRLRDRAALLRGEPSSSAQKSADRLTGIAEKALKYAGQVQVNPAAPTASTGQHQIASAFIADLKAKSAGPAGSDDIKAMAERAAKPKSAPQDNKKGTSHSEAQARPPQRAERPRPRV